MLRALHTAATGMSAQETQVNTISNNIANVNTNGFKSGRTEFEDLLYQTVQEPGGLNGEQVERPLGLQLGSGAKVSALKRDFTQGPVNITQSTYDLLIQGEGLFGIMGNNDQMYYTRDGSFTVNSQGELTTKNGYKVYPGIAVPNNTTHLNVSSEGKVDAYVQGQTDPLTLGTIPVFNFVNQAGLKAMGNNLMMATMASGAATEGVASRGPAGAIQQGALEASNVNVMNEMTNLIQAQRAYELNSKVMGVADQMLQTVNNVK